MTKLPAYPGVINDGQEVINNNFTVNRRESYMGFFASEELSSMNA